jgi:hypothetical protein
MVAKDRTVPDYKLTPALDGYAAIEDASVSETSDGMLGNEKTSTPPNVAAPTKRDPGVPAASPGCPDAPPEAAANPVQSAELIRL